MQGYQITFFTHHDRRHEGKHLADWLVDAARTLGIRGATVLAGTEGFGQHRRLHSAHFFELADQPIEVTMVASGEETERLFAHLRAHGVRVFYARSPVEFGIIGDDDA